MGYTTDFEGSFSFDKPLKKEHADYLRAFNQTRRMKRDELKSSLLTDTIRHNAGLPIGTDGSYFVGSSGLMGQDKDDSVIDYNTPPQGQPGLWCQWTASDDNEHLEWDGGEKFYYYIEWLEYIIDNFLNPWGYKITGVVKWYGEDHDDKGEIIVIDNSIEVHG